jgi:site-specific DNA-methyltransferase (adenine-specific)
MMNALSCCDSLALLGSQAPGTIDLVYVDPPFNVGAELTARPAPGERRGRKGAGPGPVAYADRWGGIDGFLAFLEPNLEAVREALSERGVLWLHLDHRAVHEAKVACDRVLGRGAFRGEIIWAPGNGARRRTGPSMTHQTLLVYSKDARANGSFTWNGDEPSLREPFAETSMRMHFQNVDAGGRRYRDRTIGGKTYRYYADEGRRLGSVWTDIPAMAANTPIGREGTGYPTQKPEKLLERVVLLSSNPGETVCDPMCGSGTTLVVAARLGRRFVGGDASRLAFEMASRRLQGQGVAFEGVEQGHA